MSSSGRPGSAERTMLASRWHSPPKPPSVLSWVTGTCSAASRSASMQPCTSPSSTPTRTPGQVGHHPLEQRGLARARRAHEVHDAHARAVEVGAVGLGDRVVGVERVLDDPHLCAMHVRLLDLDRLDLELVAGRDLDPRRPPRTPGTGTTGSSISHSLPHSAQRSRAGTSSCSSRAPSQTVSLRDEAEVELERVGHDLAQRADRMLTTLTRRPAGVLDGGVHDRAGERELVHRLSPRA